MVESNCSKFVEYLSVFPKIHTFEFMYCIFPTAIDQNMRKIMDGFRQLNVREVYMIIEDDDVGVLMEEFHACTCLQTLKIRHVNVLDTRTLDAIGSNPNLEKFKVSGLDANKIPTLLTAMKVSKSKIVSLHLEEIKIDEKVTKHDLFDMFSSTDLESLKVSAKHTDFKSDHVIESILKNVVNSPRLTTLVLNEFTVTQQIIDTFVEHLPRTNLLDLTMGFRHLMSSIFCVDVRGLLNVMQSCQITDLWIWGKYTVSPDSEPIVLEGSSLRSLCLENLSIYQINEIVTLCFGPKCVVNQLELKALFNFQDDPFNAKNYKETIDNVLSLVSTNARVTHFRPFFAYRPGRIVRLFNDTKPSVKTKQALFMLSRVFHVHGLSQHIAREVLLLICGE